jgi:FHA domain-containing protein
MNLVLRALSLNEQPLTQAIEGMFDARGGTIGRSDSNTIALPDPERHISRLQAEVMAEGAGYLIRNAGGANAILLNGDAVAPGERRPIAPGDDLRIGGYLLRVYDAADPDSARTITRGRAPVDARTVIAASAREQRTGPPSRPAAPASAPVPAAPPAPTPAPRPAMHAATVSDNPFADLLGGTPLNDNDPFAGLGLGGSPAAAGTDDPFAGLAAPVPAPAVPAPAVAATATAWPLETPASPPAARLPDDFDPFAGLADSPPSPAAAPSGGQQPDLLASVGASAGSVASIDDLFGLGTPVAGGADPLAAFAAPPPASTAGSGPGLGGADTGTDPLALFSAPTAPPPAQAPTASNHVPEWAGAFEPPRVAAPSPAQHPAPDPPPAPTPAPTAPVRAPSAHPASADPLWQAFCEGAGIRPERATPLDADQMRVMGQLMREAVEGTLRLMKVRATVKQELHAEVTTIRSRNNNPLKFSPDAQMALEQMLAPPLRGFMPGAAAMQDAMHDLVGHSIGTMAGMRAALAGVLGRFQPQQLEAKLAGKSMMDSLLPMNRKARLWELYLQHYGTISGEAEDDFHALFGKAFVAAYEQELDRLPRGRDE